MKTSKIFVTVDVILRKNDQILLIQRKNEPYKDHWALPGGFVEENEDLEVAAQRELQEETSISASKLSQVGAFGKPFRDPRHHTISVVYFADVPEETEAIAADDAKEAAWFDIHNLPELAFDHQEIIDYALAISNHNETNL